MTTKVNAKDALVVVSNSTGLMRDIQDAAIEITQIKKEVKSLNDRKKAIRERMNAKGIDKLGFDMAMSFFARGLADREGFQSSYDMAKEAIQAIQGDLFPPKVDDEE